MAVFIGSMAFADISPSLPTKANGLNGKSVEIVVFVREGCPHCAEAKAFLQDLKREQPKLNLIFYDVIQEPSALERLQQLAKGQGINTVRVPAIYVGGQLVVGYSKEAGTDRLIRDALTTPQIVANQDSAGSCEIKEALSCEAGNSPPSQDIDVWGHKLSVTEIGLPLFTLAIGLLDGFNPCSLWVLLLMVSLLAPMNDRVRMLAIAGTFVAIEGLVYFIFMSAWLNLFLLIGLSRMSEIAIAAIALLAGMIHIKDFQFYGQGVSLSIPASAKPGIYARLRKILQAQNMAAALIGAAVLAVLVQIVEFMCTSGFPALYTRVLTLNHLDSLSYYGYLLLYNLAYMFDDIIILAIGVITLSQRRLQEQEGRWLKLISGLVMVGLGIYLLLAPTLG